MNYRIVRGKHWWRYIAFLTIVFVCFTLNFSMNFFKTLDFVTFTYFDKPSELNILTRIDVSEREGVFSYGGLFGSIVNVPELGEYEGMTNGWVYKQYDMYLRDEPIGEGFETGVYKSQSGGQAILYGFMQKALPFKNATRMKVFQALNALLSALVFTLFAGWVFRSFGFTSSFVTVVLLLMSTWLTRYGHSIYWVLWAYYIPFLGMLLILEKQTRTNGGIDFVPLSLWMFVCMFIKCIFCGFEFISSTLVMAVCPVFFYCVKEKVSFGHAFKSLLSVSVAALIGVLAQMMVLLVQLRSFLGSFSAGLAHIEDAFTRRSVTMDSQYTLGDIIRIYLTEDYPLFTQWLPFKISFGLLALIIIVLAAVLCLAHNRTDRKDYRRCVALMCTTYLSLLGPFSWFILFKGHAEYHFFLDYIVWYMPFMLFGFVVIGLSVQKIIMIFVARYKKTDSINIAG